MLFSVKLDADAPKCIKKLLSNNLALPTSLNAAKVIGKQGYKFGSYGLAILMTYSVLGPQKAIEWIKRHIAKDFNEIVKNCTKLCME